MISYAELALLHMQQWHHLYMQAAPPGYQGASCCVHRSVACAHLVLKNIHKQSITEAKSDINVQVHS